MDSIFRLPVDSEKDSESASLMMASHSPMRDVRRFSLRWSLPARLAIERGMKSFVCIVIWLISPSSSIIPLLFPVMTRFSKLSGGSSSDSSNSSWSRRSSSRISSRSMDLRGVLPLSEYRRPGRSHSWLDAAVVSVALDADLCRNEKRRPDGLRGVWYSGWGDRDLPKLCRR